MPRKLWLLILVATIVVPAGCGFVREKLPYSMAHLPGATSRQFDAPLSKVIDAARDAEGDFRLSGVVPVDLEMNVDPTHPDKLPKGVEFVAATGEVVVDPEKSEANRYLIEGRTKDGRRLAIWLEGRDHRQKSDVTVQIGEKGEEALANLYFGRMTRKLANPDSHTPEELEKRKIRLPFSEPLPALPEPVESTKSDRP